MRVEEYVVIKVSTKVVKGGYYFCDPAAFEL
jgi:hypothetical protein